MKDFQFQYKDLKSFSESNPYTSIPSEYHDLYNQLKTLEKDLNFPAVHDDIGSTLNFLFQLFSPRNIFEFGSGYGQSAFWYFLNNPSIEKIILTEKRDDLVEKFHALPWPSQWKEKMEYHQEDAFETIKRLDSVDFVLIDGVKANYKDFLQECESKITANGLVAIDNSFWRGSFMYDEMVEKKKSARKIKELHDYISASEFWTAIFLPFTDGLTLLRPKSK